MEMDTALQSAQFRVARDQFRPPIRRHCGGDGVGV
jgi:hypothetical protein